MRLYLIGKNGLLGKEFLSALSDEGGPQVFAFDSETLDICDEKKVCELFEANPPDFVINCAAYTKVDDAEDNRDEAFALNAKAVANLARCCKAENATLLHFSTDYVFDGNKGSAYYEDDETRPISVYGESKLEGEKLIQGILPEHYIVRTSLLFGEHGQNFVDLMRRLLLERDKLQVIGDKVASPTYAKDLAQVCIEFFVRPFAKSLDKPKFGIYHITNSGACSRYELVAEIARIIGSKANLEEVSSDVFAPKAERPANSELKSSKSPEMRSWQQALKAYLSI